MNTSKVSADNPRTRQGLSLIEMLTVVTIVGILAGITGPAISRIIRHDRANRAATFIAADLHNAFAVAARQRAPVRISADVTTMSYQFIDRKTGKVLRIRIYFGDASEYRLTSLVFNPTTIDVFPSGVSSAALTVDLASGDYARQITASTAGFVRVKPR